MDGDARDARRKFRAAARRIHPDLNPDERYPGEKLARLIEERDRAARDDDIDAGLPSVRYEGVPGTMISFFSPHEY